MPDFDDSVTECQDQHKLSIAEMISSAHRANCRNEVEARAIEGFLNILESYHKETIDLLKAIKKCGSILSGKLKDYQQNQQSESSQSWDNI